MRAPTASDTVRHRPTPSDTFQFLPIPSGSLVQVMVFVHARSDTVRTARALLDLARKENTADVFVPNYDEFPTYQLKVKEVGKSKSPEVRGLFAGGF